MPNEQELWALVHTVLWIMAGIALAVLITYVIGAIFSKGSIIETTWNKEAGAIKAHQAYYLPTANLLLKATAKVVVTKQADGGTIVSAKLAELVFEPTVQIVPDTDQVFALQYCVSVFSNDDLKFSVGPSGLLEGINLTAEDRITNIITQLADAPRIILQGDQAAEARAFKAGDEAVRDGMLLTTETRDYTNNFFILTAEIRKKTAERSWTINVDGTAEQSSTVDAGFTINFSDQRSRHIHSGDKQVYEGILSRPLQTVIMTITKKGAPTTPAVEYQLAIPDESRMVVMPVKRAAFVKKTYSCKMVNGMLTESALNKPSQVEGFISIPIKIAKAIVSIPAQLLSFRIENIKRQTTLETEQQHLLNAQFESQKARIAGETALLEAEKTLLNTRKEIVAATTDMAATKKEWERVKPELENLLREIEEKNQNKFKNG